MRSAKCVGKLQTVELTSGAAMTKDADYGEEKTARN
jgi:hypothetical protein